MSKACLDSLKIVKEQMDSESSMSILTALVIQKNTIPQSITYYHLPLLFFNDFMNITIRIYHDKNNKL